ncbi:MAG TPA: arylsulfatase [Verrucomicrobiae bacterium]|nr:arylsulfatase [Verrucomicrobiae bacterium]
MWMLRFAGGLGWMRWIPLLGLAVLGCGDGRGASPARSHPNVLLCLTDDQGYGDVALHGNPYLTTPQMDRLAHEGVRFERFYVNSFCAPTRAALLTGRYPLRCGVFGVTHNKETMRSEEVTIAEALRGAGYHTACVGKWHNGEQYPYTPPGQGFDEFLGFHNGHINNYFDPVLIRGAQPVATRGYVTDVLTGEAVRFIREERNRPFFLYLAYNAPHSPYQVPDAYYEKYRSKGLSEAVAAFYGMCENIDDNLGKVLATLEERGLARDTIVLFLTDNGTGTTGKIFNAGMRGAKTSVHEGGCRVPLFVRWPTVFDGGRVVEQIASHIDIFPTLLDLCGVPKPEGPALDGLSLRPLLEGRPEGWPARVLFTHNPIDETNRYPGAVRTQRYRLVREFKGRSGGSGATNRDAAASPWQLYDMLADPGEENDIAANMRGEVARLSALYESWIDDVRGPGLRRFPIPAGYEQENPVTINAPQAYFEGGLHFNSGPGFAHDFLTGWSDLAAKVWFEVDVARAGTFSVDILYGCPAADAGSRIRVSVSGGTIEAVVSGAEAPVIPLPHRDAEGNAKYINRQWGVLRVGALDLPAGPAKLEIRALSMPAGRVMDFKGIVLTRR